MRYGILIFPELLNIHTIYIYFLWKHSELQHNSTAALRLHLFVIFLNKATIFSLPQCSVLPAVVRKYVEQFCTNRCFSSWNYSANSERNCYKVEYLLIVWAKFKPGVRSKPQIYCDLKIYEWPEWNAKRLYCYK